MQIRTRIVGVIAVSAAAVAVMAGPAFASVAQGPTNVGNIIGNYNISGLSGNNVYAPVTLPINVCGNAAAVLGFANAGCQGGATALVDSLNGL